MASELFCQIVNNVIIVFNIPRPLATPTVSFSNSSSDNDLRDAGFYPVVQINNNYNPVLQNITGPIYSIDIGNRNVNATFTIIDKTLAEVVSNKLSDLATYRYIQETKSVIFNHVAYSLDLISQSRLTTAFIAAKNNLITSFNFKSATGNYIVLSASDLINACEYLFGYVEGCFTTEAQHMVSINGLTRPFDVVNYDITTSWPQANFLI